MHGGCHPGRCQKAADECNRIESEVRMTRRIVQRGPCNRYVEPNHWSEPCDQCDAYTDACLMLGIDPISGLKLDGRR